MNSYFQNDIPPWVRVVVLNMDNCGGTNKSQFVFAFLANLVRIGRFDKIYMKFMIAGHTKVSKTKQQ